ncbi:MAG: GntR family transcriptional regulator, partial [Pseudomonadota bacterium]
GAVVADLSADEAAEIYALGAVLESFAARLAAERATPAAVERLRELLAAMQATLERGDADAQTRYMTLDDEFHGTILAMAENRRLDAVMRQMVRVPVLVQAFHRYRDEDLQQSLNQHRGIVAALAAGDPEWAETAMRAHVLSARAVMIPGQN